MEKKIVMSLAIIAVITAIIFFSFALYFNALYQIDYVPITVPIGEVVGINADSGGLFFGTTPPGSISERSLEVETNKIARISFVVEGVDFVEPSKNDFVLDAGEKRSIRFLASPPWGTEKGLYEGRLKIITKNV